MILDRNRAVPGKGGLPLLRVHPGSQVELVIESEGILCMATHYIGRGYLCALDDCPACGSWHMRAKVYFVASLQTTRDSRLVLIEMSLNSFNAAESRGKMLDAPLERGRVVVCSRRKSNSPLSLDPLEETRPTHPGFDSLQKVASAIAVLYGLSPIRPDESVEEWSDRLLPQVRTQLLAAMKRELG